MHIAMIKILNFGKNCILQRFFSVVHVARGDSRILALGAWAPYKTCIGLEWQDVSSLQC